MSEFEPPAEANNYLAGHVALLRDSFRLWTGRELIPQHLQAADAARYLFHAPFAVLSHDTATDPRFNYANNKSMKLFEMEWQAITSLPSRLSAEALDRQERQRLLDAVSEKGFIDDYQGVRISSSGRRFRIVNATVWNLVDMDGEYAGQAAMFADWKFL